MQASTERPFAAGSSVRVAPHASGPGQGLTYPAMVGVLLEPCETDGWDVIDVQVGGETVSVYSFDVTLAPTGMDLLRDALDYEQRWLAECRAHGETRRKLEAALGRLEASDKHAPAGGWAAQPAKMLVLRGNEIPRASDDPCDADCPGWAVFEVSRCTVHGDECDLSQADCSRLEIQACDACWHGNPDAPGGDYYEAHPICQAQLATERASEGAEDDGEADDAWTGGISENH